MNQKQRAAWDERRVTSLRAIQAGEKIAKYKELKLGDKVIFEATLKRRSIVYGDVERRFWEVVLSMPREGIYIGWRMLSNGDYDTETGRYESEHAFKVALVAFSEIRSPVYVEYGAIENVKDIEQAENN